MTARERFRADLARYYSYLPIPESRLQRLKAVLGTEAIWAIALYRFGQYLHEEAASLIRFLLHLPYALAVRFVRIVVGIHLQPITRIGPGLYIGHYGGVWISPRVVIGAQCNISHEVTIGATGVGERPCPVLGDRVWVGPNATITGRVRVASGAVIAANSLVVSNIPENGVAVGVPARVISYSGSTKLLELPPTLPDDDGSSTEFGYVEPSERTGAPRSPQRRAAKLK